MELKLVNGDYVPDGAGGMTRLSGADEVLGRVLFRLTARRGSLPFLPELGCIWSCGRNPLPGSHWRPSMWRRP